MDEFGEVSAPAMTHTAVAGWRIEALVLTDFKSYAGEQKIGPFADFQAIIGPNGAGKSNMMDAISFVLGVRANHLRGSQLRDLIHNPSGAPLPDAASASVAMILAHTQPGGSVDKRLHFKRAIKAAGGGSDYRIDDKSVTRAAYDDTLKSLNILVKARNFLVFQGDVEAIAAKTPKDFTAMLEEISGSGELQEAYAAALKAKLEAEDNTIFTFQKKKGINAEKKRFKEQKDEAEEFQRLQRSAVELDQLHVLWQLFHIATTLDQLTGLRERSAVALQRAEEAVEAAESHAGEGRKLMARAQQASLVADKAAREAAAAVDAKKAERAAVSGERERTVRRKNQTAISLDKLRAQQDAQKRDIEALEKDLRDAEKVAKTLDSAGAALPELELTPAQRAEYTALQDDAGRQSNTQRAARATKSMTRTLALEVAEGLDAQRAELDAALAQQTETAAGLEARAEKMKAFVAENEQLRVEQERLLSEERKAKAEREARVNELGNTFEDCEAQLKEAKSAIKARSRAEEDQRVLDDLRRLFPGVRGRLVNLCDPTQARFRVAVTVAMQAHLDSIVCDDERVAMQCIQYLKEQRLAPRTFLPLNSLRTKPVNEAARSLGNGVRLALDVLQFDAAVRPAVHYAVGSALIADTVELARSLAFGPDRHDKVIALDGTAVRRSGLISGGLASLEENSNRWSEKKISALITARDECVAELAELALATRRATPLAELEATLTGLENRVKYAKADLKSCASALATGKRECAQLRARIDTLAEQAQAKRDVVAQLDVELREADAAIAAIEDTVFAGMSAKLGVDNVRHYERERLAEVQRRADEAARVEGQLAQLRQQLEFEKQRDLGASVAKLEERVSNDEASLAAADKNLVAMDKEIVKLEKALAKQREQVDKAEAMLALAEKETVAERDAATKAAAHRADAYKRLAQLDAQYGELRTTRHELYQRCKVEQIQLPAAGEDEEGDEEEEPEGRSRKRGKRKSKKRPAVVLPGGAQSNSQELQSLLELEDDVAVDFSDVPDAQRIEAGFKSPEYVAEQERQREEIANTRAKIDQMAPNMRAIERFEKSVRRLRETDDVLETTREKAKAADDEFKRIKDERVSRFRGAFNVIAGSIDGIYKELTRGRNLAVVGTAMLTLENEEEPYLAGVKFNAMPPNKVFRDMEQLSGGEKTVAALALLFAIHQYRPSPFFVLDEVDAALDAQNVSKVANYIRSRKDLQTVVISLKDSFFKKAESLVGVYRDENTNSSGHLQMDLTPYDF